MGFFWDIKQNCIKIKQKNSTVCCRADSRHVCSCSEDSRREYERDPSSTPIHADPAHQLMSRVLSPALPVPGGLHAVPLTSGRPSPPHDLRPEPHPLPPDTLHHHPYKYPTTYEHYLGTKTRPSPYPIPGIRGHTYHHHMNPATANMYSATSGPSNYDYGPR